MPRCRLHWKHGTGKRSRQPWNGLGCGAGTRTVVSDTQSVVPHGEEARPGGLGLLAPGAVPEGAAQGLWLAGPGDRLSCLG